MPETDFTIQYNRLNPEQREAVDTIEGPVLVIAGPGSGKTQLLSLRVANILEKTDTLPGSILCLTFTESAANNMRERLVSIIGRDAHKVAIHTFHSFGSEIINQNPEYFFFGAGYQPVDELGQYQIFRDIFKELAWDNPLNSYHQDHEYTYLKDTQAIIKALKNGGMTPENFGDILERNQVFLQQIKPLLQDFFSHKVDIASVNDLPQLIEAIENQDNTKSDYGWQHIFPTLKSFILRELKLVAIKIAETTENRKKTMPLSQWKKSFMTYNGQKELLFKDTQSLNKQKAVQQIYTLYQERLHKQKLYDFEDMLLEVVKTLENPQTVELKYNLQERYQYILVDEFQDTNGVQTKLLENLLESEISGANPNILAVGDDDQAIFKFQGASVQNILKFREKYPTARIVTLTKNYRSTQDILDFSMQIIEQSEQRLSKLEGINKILVSTLD